MNAEWGKIMITFLQCLFRICVNLRDLRAIRAGVRGMCA
jgi:hypothetical protein